MREVHRQCPDCGVFVGKPHEGGCDVARCMLCGGQLLSCWCVYRIAGMPTDFDGLEREQPVIFHNGATEAMWLAYDAEVAKVGGPDVWTGRWPGDEECEQYGWYARMEPGKQGWQPCAATDEGARLDLNRLHPPHAIWSPEKRRWVKAD